MMKKILVFLCFLLPVQAFAQTLPEWTEFTPLQQRRMFSNHEWNFVLFRDDFCSRCDRQLQVVEEGLSQLDSVEFLEDAGSLSVIMRLWSGDPFVRNLNVRRLPTMVVFRKDRVVARFERVPSVDEVVEVFAPYGMIEVKEESPPIARSAPAEALDVVDVPIREAGEEMSPDSGPTYPPLDWGIPSDDTASIDAVSGNDLDVDPSLGDPAAMEDEWQAIREKLRPNERLEIRDGLPTIVVDDDQ